MARKKIQFVYSFQLPFFDVTNSIDFVIEVNVYYLLTKYSANKP